MCPLTTGQPGASPGPLEGPHRGAPPRAPTPRAGSRQGAEEGGVSPRVNPREALVGCSQTPTGAQVGLQRAFYPALADGDHPPGLRVPSLQPFCGLVWPSGGRFWDLRLAGLERMNHPSAPRSHGHVVSAPHLTPGLTHPSTFTPQGQGWAHESPPAPSECRPGAGYRATCLCVLHSGPRKGLRR